MVSKKMNENVFCYLSEIGHKNFYYPTKVKVIIEKDTDYEVIPWISTDKKLQAIKVKNKNIVYLKPLPDHGQTGDSILWIEKDKLPLSSVG